MPSLLCRHVHVSAKTPSARVAGCDAPALASRNAKASTGHTLELDRGKHRLFRKTECKGDVSAMFRGWLCLCKQGCYVGEVLHNPKLILNASVLQSKSTN